MHEAQTPHEASLRAYGPTRSPDTLRTLRIRLFQAAPPVPPGGRFWHGFAVRRPPFRRAGRGLTFGRVPMHATVLPDRRGVAATHPVQMALSGGKKDMHAKASGPTFFTERSLAAYLAVSDRTVRNWIRRGELPSYKLGASRRIDPADVETFLEQRREEAA